MKSYIHVRDVSRGELSILREGRIGQVYHLSPDRGRAVREVVSTIGRQMGKTLHEMATAVEERPGQDAAYVIDSTRAHTELGWKPDVDFEEGVDEVVQWVTEYWEEILRQPLEYEHRP